MGFFRCGNHTARTHGFPEPATNAKVPSVHDVKYYIILLYLCRTLRHYEIRRKTRAIKKKNTNDVRKKQPSFYRQPRRRYYITTLERIRLRGLHRGNTRVDTF